MRFVVYWYDGNEFYSCLVDVDGPFGMDEGIINYLNENKSQQPEGWTGDVEIQVAIELPDISGPITWIREPDESYGLFIFNQDSEGESDIPYYDLRS